MATPEAVAGGKLGMRASQEQSVSSVSEKFGKYKREEGKREEDSKMLSENSLAKEDREEAGEEATVVV